MDKFILRRHTFSITLEKMNKGRDTDTILLPTLLPIIYHQKNPDLAENAQSLCEGNNFTIDDYGQIVPVQGKYDLLALVLPLSALYCIGWTIYTVVHVVFYILTGKTW